MRKTMVVVGAVLFSIGIAIYSSWKELGLSCPCLGSAFVTVGCVLILARRLFPVKKQQSTDTRLLE